MHKRLLVTGGAKSGKSRYAEDAARAFDLPLVYIATAQPLDGEMQDRILAHQAQRGPIWQTEEEPLDLSGALRRSDGQGVRLVDCLTLWLSNLLMDERDWDKETDALCGVLLTQRSPVVLVTNEVGGGIVPVSALGRHYRDASGVMNQRIAAVADKVVLVTCGLPLTLKG
tara:strand:+ start:1457 stop:1966 length:510 start_codon:yes stop_codon:yes gene_type:complete